MGRPVGGERSRANLKLSKPPGCRSSPPRSALSRLLLRVGPRPERYCGRAMSNNVEAARRWVELFNDQGDVNEFVSLHDPEVEMQTPGGPRLRGHVQVREWYEDDYEHVRPRILPDRFVGEGDVVVGLGALVLTWLES